MPRPIRYLIIFLTGLLLLAAAALLALTTLFDPNDYKPQIAEQVRRASSLELRMPGEINWKLFPRLALSMGETELHTENRYANDTLFAKLQSFSMGISWQSLLKGAPRGEHLAVESLELRLVTDQRGYSNWKDVEAVDAGGEQESTQADAAPLAFELAELSLRDIAVTIIDQQLASEQQFLVERFDAQYVNFTGRPFPVELDALFSDGAKQYTLAMQAEAVVDNAKERYALEKLSGRFDQSNFTGSVTIGLGKQTSFNGKLALDQLNLDNYVEDSGENSAAQSAADTPAASASDEDISFDALKALNTRFRLDIGTLVSSGATLQQVSVDTAAANGVLRLNNLQAEVFGGNIKLAATLDASGKTARLDIEQAMSGVEIAEVFKSQEIQVNLSGKTAINSRLAMRGNSVDTWMSSLNGTTRFVFDDGRYGDDNIEYRVCQAIALARQEVLGPAQGSATEFQSVQADINWQNGVGRITRFDAGLDNFKLSGDGLVSLLDQSVDLRVVANITGDIGGEYPACMINERYRNIKWPLRCRGNASDTKCGVDNSRLDKILAGVVKERAKQEVQEAKEKVTEKIGEKLEEKLGKDVGEALKGLFK